MDQVPAFHSCSAEEVRRGAHFRETRLWQARHDEARQARRDELLRAGEVLHYLDGDLVKGEWCGHAWSSAVQVSDFAEYSSSTSTSMFYSRLCRSYTGLCRGHTLK